MESFVASGPLIRAGYFLRTVGTGQASARTNRAAMRGCPLKLSRRTHAHRDWVEPVFGDQTQDNLARFAVSVKKP